MSSEDLRLARMWYAEDKKSCYEIAKLLHRRTATIVNRGLLHLRVKQQVDRLLSPTHKSFIEKSIGNMKVRCQRLLAARGRHFEEGGE